jgi:hypothetical protein
MVRTEKCFLAAALAAAALLSLAACTLPGQRGSELQSSSADGPQPTIEAAGFGGRGNYLWVTSIVRDVQPGQFVTVSFNLLSADGTILATENQTEQGVNANARMIIGTQVRAPDGPPVASVHPSIQVQKYDRPKPKFADVILSVGQVSIGRNTVDQPAAKALISNPSAQQIPGARVGIACFNSQGYIIGGGSTFPQVLPARGQIMASGDIMVSQSPARCEMTAQPSPY